MSQKRRHRANFLLTLAISAIFPDNLSESKGKYICSFSRIQDLPATESLLDLTKENVQHVFWNSRWETHDYWDLFLRRNIWEAADISRSLSERNNWAFFMFLFISKHKQSEECTNKGSHLSSSMLDSSPISSFLSFSSHSPIIL